VLDAAEARIRELEVSVAEAMGDEDFSCGWMNASHGHFSFVSFAICRE
jgi:hypothetical protein